jgi:hypothetical protein
LAPISRAHSVHPDRKRIVTETRYFKNPTSAWSKVFADYWFSPSAKRVNLPPRRSLSAYSRVFSLVVGRLEVKKEGAGKPAPSVKTSLV